MTDNRTLIPAIVIGGQTASGKSSLAVRACREFCGEIISADSIQVYRGMDIGSAKPSKEDLSAVRHHLIDILDISEPFSSADFISRSTDALGDITSRGKLPFVTGGTGLYSEMLFNSFSLDESRGDPEIRKKLTEEAASLGNEELYSRLAEIDPASAAKTHPNNVRRVVRYLEIYYATGKTASEMNEVNNSGERIYSPLYICLFSADREYIYSRINERVDVMFDMGLENEVRELCEMGLESSPTASAGIGYKEFFPYFRGEYDLETAKELIKQHSRNYAKRQYTYFKRISGCRHVDISEGDPTEKVFEMISEHIKRG